MPIGAAGNPHFGDFMNRKDAQTTKTRHSLVAIRQIRQASITADFNGKLNFPLNSRLRGSGNGGFSWAKRFFPGIKSGNEGGKRRLRPWVIIGRFVGKFALVHFRASYLEVDLDDIRSTNRLI